MFIITLCKTIFSTFIYFTCMGFLPARMPVYHMNAWCPERAEEESNLLQLESQMVASLHMGLEIEPKSSGRAANSLSCKSIYPVPQVTF